MDDFVLLTSDHFETNKKRIIEIFKLNVKGKIADVSSANKGHDGKHGHWLESAMGIVRNNKNAPDLLGFK